MKKLISGFLTGLMVISALSIAGCGSTWNGVGQDIEQMGKSMQGSDEEKKDNEKT